MKSIQKYIIFFPILVILLFSCNLKERKNSNSLLRFVNDEKGENIKVDDFLALTWTERTEDGKLIASSGNYDDRPDYFSRRKSDFKGDFYSMLGLLSEGDSAIFKVYKKGKYFIYNVRVHKVVARNQLNDSLFNIAIEDYREKLIAIEKKREPQKIEKYTSTKQLNLIRHPSGFKYKVITLGKGNKPSVNDTVSIQYTGETLTGKIFETTDQVLAKKEGIFNEEINYAPVKIPVQVKPGLSAFLQAIAMFPKGTKVMLLIPSALAYGKEYYSVLAPYSPMVCNLEIVDIIHQ